MKKTTIFVCLVIAFFVIFATVPILLLTRNVSAEQGIRLEMEDNTLIVLEWSKTASKWSEKARYPGVPEGIDKEVAYKATEEGETEYTINEEYSFKFSFPVVETKTLQQRQIFYKDKKWRAKSLESIEERRNDWTMTAVLIVIFIVFMVLVGLVGNLIKKAFYDNPS